MNRTAAPKVPKYWQLVEHFRAQIDGGQLKPGDRLPSLAEMKDQGVSRPVMEKVHQILEAEGLIQRQPGSGTFVSQRRKRETTGIVGISGWGFHFDAQSSYWSTLLAGVREAAHKHELQLLHLDHRSNKGWEKADGVLLCDWSSAQTLRLVPAELPCVSLLVQIDGIASVYADDYAGVRSITEHLIQAGHCNIAYLHGRDSTVVPRRVRGYKDALRAAGIKSRKEWMRKLPGKIDYGAQFIEAGHNAMRRWLSENWDELACTALIAHNDEVAIGAMAALREKGVDIPGDVSVVGFDGLQISDYITPRLTTVDVPLHQIGMRALEILHAQIQADKRDDRHEILPLQVRVRDSVARR